MASAAETQSAYEIAARALPAIRRLLPDVGPVRTLQDFFDQLTAAETEAERAYEKLVALRRDGLDRREDYAVYRKLQDEMYRAQISVLGVVRVIAGPLAPTIATRLPVPTPLPALTWESRHASQARQGVSGLGLGFLPIVAAVVAVLVAMGLAYLLSDEIEAIFQDLATVVLARGRAAQQTQLIEERRRAFDACTAAGGSRAECTSEAAALVPTPTEAGTEMPSLPPNGGGGSPLRTLLWVGLGVVVVGGLGAGLIYAFGGGRRYGYYGMGGYGNVPHRATGKLPGRVADLDGTKSRYYLEV